MKINLKRVVILLVIVLIAINYSYLDSLLKDFLNERSVGVVERVVDGDTLIINGQRARMLGINTPERGERYYEEAKIFLNESVFNKTVEMEFGRQKKDRYNRTLAYIFFNGENINLKLVEEGLANPYYPSGKDRYSGVFYDRWKECIEKGEKNLCQRSEDYCSKCITLKEFSPEKQKVVLKNSCEARCSLDGWTIKDEGRKKYIFEGRMIEPGSELEIVVGEGADSKERVYWTGKKYVWTSSGDSLFLRDSEGKLVLWENY